MSRENPTERSPLKFEDVAFAASIRWAVAEKSALKYFKFHFETPAGALAELKANADRAPDAFWETL